MRENRKTLGWLLAAFVFLLAVSLYRQQGKLQGVQDLLHPLVVYVGYLVLLGGWWLSIQLRISQRNLRRYLLAGIVVMVFWMTLHFLQDSVYAEDLYFRRLSGYYISLPIVMLPLFGLYAVLGLDKGPDYRISRRWYWLLVPAVGLILLMLTNEMHHLVFLEEKELNIRFRPNGGIYLIALWAAVLIFFRLKLLREKSKRNKDYPRLRSLPFAIGILMAMMYIPYFVAFFDVRLELIELTAKHTFMEALMWESCIFLGMVPVNTQYGQVFADSTVAMQITDEHGVRQIASGYAPEVSAAEFQELKQKKRLNAGGDRELCLHDFGGGYLIWQRDLSVISGLLTELRQTAEELEQEGTLLQRELAAKSEESRIQAKNAIYDRLDGEITGELQLLDRLLEEQSGEVRQWQKIGLVGTYVKRLCNLRLVFEETGKIEMDDLYISVENLMFWVRQLCPGAQFCFQPWEPLAPEMCFLAMKATAYLLECVELTPEDFSLTITDALELVIRSSGAYSIPAERVGRVVPENCTAQWRTQAGQLTLTVRKRGE